MPRSTVSAHCVDGRDEVISRQIEDALDPDSSTGTDPDA
jgi:hypothetical protein